MWTTHPHLTLSLSMDLKGAVATSVVWATCFAIVLATTLRRSLTTLPLHTASNCHSAVSRPNLKPWQNPTRISTRAIVDAACARNPEKCSNSNKKKVITKHVQRTTCCSPYGFDDKNKSRKTRKELEHTMWVSSRSPNPKRRTAEDTRPQFHF